MMMIMIKPTQQPNQQPETNVNVRTWITCIDFYTAKESRLGGDSDKREEDFTAYGLQTHTHTHTHSFIVFRGNHHKAIFDVLSLLVLYFIEFKLRKKANVTRGKNQFSFFPWTAK